MYRIARFLRARSSFAVCLIVLTGCLEYETSTTVHDDGSFTRTAIIKGDSTALHVWDLRIPVDSSWTVTDRSRIDDKKWTMTAERTFASSDAWNEWERGLTRRVVQSSVSVERSFRFFTTVYRYTETIAAYNPFDKVPITDFISDSELDMFLRFEVLKESSPSRGDSLALEDAGDRFQEWEVRTRVESFFGAIEARLDAGSASAAARLLELKESLVQTVLAGKESDLSIKQIRSWARKSKDTALQRAVEAAVPELRRLEEDLEFVKEVGGDSYTTRVLLPGEIISSNGQLEGKNGAIWTDYIAYAYFKDFTMVAESSTVNVWAIVLTLGVIVGIPILVWVGWMLRKRTDGR